MIRNKALAFFIAVLFLAAFMGAVHAEMIANESFVYDGSDIESYVQLDCMCKIYHYQ